MIEVTPFHRSDIEYISQHNYFHSDTTIRRAYIFATTKNEYGIAVSQIKSLQKTC